MREPFFQMFWNRLSAVGKQNSAFCECPWLLHQLRPLEELLCCAEHFRSEHFLLRWICLLFWTFFYSAERSPCADYFYAMLIFSVPSICCCDEKFMLHWTFSCCAEHFSLLHWSMFQQCFSCSLAEEFSKLERQLWKVMRYVTFVFQVSFYCNNNSQCGKLNQWSVKSCERRFKTEASRSSLLVVELLKPLQSDNACSQSSTNRQSCSRRTPAELQGVFWSCKGVFHI